MSIVKKKKDNLKIFVPRKNACPILILTLVSETHVKSRLVIKVENERYKETEGSASNSSCPLSRTGLTTHPSSSDYDYDPGSIRGTRNGSDSTPESQMTTRTGCLVHSTWRRTPLSLPHPDSNLLGPTSTP